MANQMGTCSGHGLPGELEKKHIKLENIEGVPQNIVVNDYDSHFVVVEPDLSSKVEQSSIIKAEAPTTKTECGADIKQESSQDEETCPEGILHTHKSQPVINSNIELSNNHTPLVKQEEITPIVSFRIIVGTNNEISLIEENKNSHIIKHGNNALTNCDYNITISNTTSTQTTINTCKKVYNCDKCGYRCANKYKLEKHMLTHYVQKQYLCQFCDYKGLTQGDLRRHMVTHTKDGRYACEHCDYTSSQAGLLVQHIRTHTGEKPFSCKYCDYKCAAMSNLRSHLATHNGIKRHYCQHCNFKCLRKENLRSHTLRLHTTRKDKPLSCHHCTYRCVTKAEIIRHLRVHFR